MAATRHKPSEHASASSDSTLPLDLISRVRRGLPVSALVELAKDMGEPVETMAATLGIAPRTLARRKLSRVLDPHESERVARVAAILERATHVLGTADKARAWLKKENRALAGVTPLSLMDTDMGARAVDDVLGRIEHGVFG
jgi:putative toxin-antitoxin system antitoxin component (TIGR02293 family)